MKRQILILLMSTFLIGLLGLPLRIFHTNDTHGAYEPITYYTQEGKTALGGYLNLWEHLNILRQEAARSIYLDAGDQQTGSAFASSKYEGTTGGAVIKVFNQLELDASTYGNHEFDQNEANLSRLVEMAHYPFVSSNIINKASGKPFGNQPWQIIWRDELKIGILGLTLVELPEKVRKENVKDIELLPYTDAINRYLDELDAHTDLIILLTHNGIEADSLLATMLDERVDLIIGGHSHSYIDSPMQVNGIYIVQAGSRLSHLGVIDLEIENDRITSFESRLHPLSELPVSPENPLQSFIAQSIQRIDEELGAVIAIIPEDWTPDKFRSTPLSRWMANALKRHYQDIYQPDLAILNNGGFRKYIPAGEVTLRDMHELLPFNNTVTLFSCYGRDLLTWAELNQQIAQERPFDICETSAPGWVPGAERYYDLGGGRKLEPDRVYRVVSHDFVAGQWDKYLGFEPFDVYDTGELFLDAMIEEIQRDYGVKE